MSVAGSSSAQRTYETIQCLKHLRELADNATTTVPSSLNGKHKHSTVVGIIENAITQLEQDVPEAEGRLSRLVEKAFDELQQQIRTVGDILQVDGVGHPFGHLDP